MVGYSPWGHKELDMTMEGVLRNVLWGLNACNHSNLPGDVNAAGQGSMH